ncbi:hypothetical protein N7493_005231 [Penicillium malachiteum]|uniref:Uncharacterized protein n=1 Tax=Penicillium malachiteum TaxID=1324776 RepID=A0AAD6HN32_9EURO|nr:hypothetical protein N7493_005231 [Penicillium malachiteum]
MATQFKIVSRDSNNDGLTGPMVDLLIALLVLILIALGLVGGLLILRRKRQTQKESLLPVYNGQAPAHQRRLTITTNKSDSVLPTPSPVPEIRITFPEEEDASGRRKSGRSVVVRISDAGSVGLEPCNDDLPPYQSSDSERFQSLDIERMGGLKEKSDVNHYS